MIQNISQFIDPSVLIQTLGIVGLFAVIFAESGLFFGFFLPGDSLLFMAGILSASHHINIYLLLIGSFVFAVAGDSVGYFFGKKVGPKIFKKEDSFFFHKKHIVRAQNFYNIYGNKTIFIARFIPIVRTFAPIVAGVGSMNYKDFVTYNILGGFFWSFSMILSGYFLGNVIPDIDKYLLPIILLIVFVSILPVIFELFKNKKV